jgi:hypothetical protein
VGFEPTPLRTGAWSQRLRPLGQTVVGAGCVGLVPWLLCVSCFHGGGKQASCGIGTHDFPLTERVLCQLSWRGCGLRSRCAAPVSSAFVCWTSRSPIGSVSFGGGVAVVVLCCVCVWLQSRWCLWAAPWPNGYGVGPRNRGLQAVWHTACGIVGFSWHTVRHCWQPLASRLPQEKYCYG